MRDNFTPDEAGYYGFKFTITTDAEFLIEFGDLDSLRQARWINRGSSGWANYSRTFSVS